MCGPRRRDQEPGLPTEWWGPLSRAVFAQDTAGLVAFDTDLRVLGSNLAPETFPQMVAVRAGMRLNDLFEALGIVELGPTVSDVLRGRRPAIHRVPLVQGRGVNGRPLYLRCAALRMETARGAPLGVLVTLTDVTEIVRAEFRAGLMRRAAATLGTSLDVTETTRQLADLVVPGLADLVSVHLSDAVLAGDEPEVMHGGGEPHMRRVAVAYAGRPGPPELLRLGDALPPVADTPEVRRLQSGRTLLVPAFEPNEDMDADYLRAVVPERAHSLIAGVLYARGRVLGGVQLWRIENPVAFDQEDARLLEDVASRAALSVDNARRYTREHDVALALQQSLLPGAHTDAVGAETFGVYIPTDSSAGVGGDWYDVIPLSSLRVAFVVGDVAGHGLRASATMGRLRTAVQTLADMDLPPDELLTRIDDLALRLADGSGTDTTCATCLYAEYDPVTCRCRMASAGHPPPAVLSPDGGVRYVDLNVGPPLGIGGMPFEVTEIDLPGGSVLALYSDGLIGGDDRDLEAGMDRLRNGLERSARSVGDLEKAGRDLLGLTADGSAVDDVTLLLARVRSLPGEDSAEWNLPPDPACVAQARDLATRQLAAWGLDDLAFTVELVVSELVTNAVRYGGGPLTLRLVRGDVLVCEVSDPANTQPRLRRARTTDEGGRGLFLVAQLTSRWGSRYRQSGKTIWAELEFAPGAVPVLGFGLADL